MAGLTDATLESLGTHLSTIATHCALAPADSADGSNELTAGGRQEITWTVDGDGDLSFSAAEDFSGLPASQTVTHVQLWSAASSGTFRGSYALTGDQAANAAGEYSVTNVAITNANA